MKVLSTHSIESIFRLNVIEDFSEGLTSHPSDELSFDDVFDCDNLSVASSKVDHEINYDNDENDIDFDNHYNIEANNKYKSAKKSMDEWGWFESCSPTSDYSFNL